MGETVSNEGDVKSFNKDLLSGYWNKWDAVSMQFAKKLEKNLNKDFDRIFEELEKGLE